MPLLLYNVPGRTAVDIAPETVQALAKIGNIVGIKKASTFERMAEHARHFGPRGARDFTLLCGNDEMSARAFAEGHIDGIISVTANVAPKALADMCRAGNAGDDERCLAIDALRRSKPCTMPCLSKPIPSP